MNGTAALVPIKVTLDGGDADSPVEVDAMHDPAEHWNGFVVPCVTREAVDSLFSDSQVWGAEITWSFTDDGTLVLVDYPGTADECETRIPLADGRYRLDIGWTFLPVED